MIKRVTWFVGGAVAGAAGAGYAKKKVTRTVKQAASQVGQQLAPSRVASTAADSARRGAGSLVEALREGRDAMRDKENELKARRDLRVETLDDHLDPGDQLLVDGRPVDVGRVIVLKPKDGDSKNRRWRRSS